MFHAEKLMYTSISTLIGLIFIVFQNLNIYIRQQTGD